MPRDEDPGHLRPVAAQEETQFTCPATYTIASAAYLDALADNKIACGTLRLCPGSLRLGALAGADHAIDALARWQPRADREHVSFRNQHGSGASRPQDAGWRRGKQGARALRTRSSTRYPTYAPQVFFTAGTGIPGIFTLKDPIIVRLVKNSVFQSSPPKAMLVVAGWPWTMRPSFLPVESIT
jgi:hypothetical protein